jgi:hypothetical protein
VCARKRNATGQATDKTGNAGKPALWIRSQQNLCHLTHRKFGTQYQKYVIAGVNEIFKTVMLSDSFMQNSVKQRSIVQVSMASRLFTQNPLVKTVAVCEPPARPLPDHIESLLD